MPTGVYIRSKEFKEGRKRLWQNLEYRLKQAKNHKGTLGKHWKVKDTTKSKESAKLNSWKTQKTRRKRGWFKDIERAKENFKKCHLGVKLSEQHKENIRKGLQASGFKEKMIVRWKDLIFREKMKKVRESQVIPLKDTSIEIKMQNALKENRIKFRMHEPIIGQPDIFIEPNICIFCDGDYWHRRPERVTRDSYVNRKLKELNYIVLRFWESEINKTLNNCINIVNKYAKNTL